MNRRHAITAALAGISALPLILTGPRSSKAATVKTSRELLKIFVDSLTEHDMTKFASIYTPDGYIQHQALATNASSLGGREAVVTYFAKRIQAFPDLVVTTDATIFHDDMLCANLVYTGTHKGEYIGIAATGKKVTFNSTDIIKVRDGLMVEHWGAADLYGLAAQLKA